MLGGKGWVLALAMALLSSCGESEDPLPSAASPPVLAAPPPSQSALRFDVAGHWEGLTDQGRRIAFDVSQEAAVTNSRINFHHDCAGGRFRATVDGYQAQVRDHSFSATLHWRAEDRGRVYAGKVTVSGRFESDLFARGGFVNSLTEKPVGDALGECPSVYGTWQASRE